MIGLKTIREGTRVAVWNTAGAVRHIDGPRRLWLFRKTLEPVARFSAEADEYLVIRFRDGSAQHMCGPADIWFNAVEHESIGIHKLVPIDANEAIVIYRRAQDGAVVRRLLRGPAQYMPEPEEWLHEFTWHGSDKKNPRKKVPYALRFTKLRVIPDQTYFNVRDVRTADDALLTVQVMIFFELADIERMLDQTHDPIADFINAVTADVIDFAAIRPFEEFKRDTGALNELSAYTNLMSRADRIGYRISKVVYRGYEANPKLQAMHDNAIEIRTALQLEAETERQAQELADLKLARDAERANQRHQMDREETEHSLQINRMTHEQDLREQEAKHLQETEFKRNVDALEQEHIKAKNKEQSEFFGSLQGLQVDLTRYLVAQYQNPDRLIRIDGQQESQLHLHDQ
ncbi:MAG: hypothetical protein GXP29_08695 [Planctomycetes bacterium]|nr:hypothetical protein [Planctomycetota bacterium]